jgi:endogenous inhibitor of DNA gyrase (YacG/DUF329 family)
MTVSSEVECPSCKKWYSPQGGSRVCPFCGFKTEAYDHIEVNAFGKSSARVTEVELKSSHVKKNAFFDIIVAILTVGVPLACYFVLPILGVLLGLSAGLVNYWLTPKAKKWFVETTHISYK